MQTVFNKKMVLVESEVQCWFLYQKIERWKLVNGNISFRPKWGKEIMFLSAFPLATLQFTEKRKEKPGTRHCGISYYQVNYQSHKLTLSGHLSPPVIPSLSWDFLEKSLNAFSSCYIIRKDYNALYPLLPGLVSRHPWTSETEVVPNPIPLYRCSWWSSIHNKAILRTQEGWYVINHTTPVVLKLWLRLLWGLNDPFTVMKQQPE